MTSQINATLPKESETQDGPENLLLAAASKKELRKATRMVTEQGMTLDAALLSMFHRVRGKQPLEAFLQARKARKEQDRLATEREREKAATRWHGWFDGAADPNPGRRSIGVVLVSPDGQRHTIAQAVGQGTNNEAEYLALIALLEKAVEVGASPLHVRGDSQLVCFQVTGDWECRSPGLYPLLRRAQSAMGRIADVHIEWVRREQNKEADALSQQALGKKDTLDEDRQWSNQTTIGRDLGLSAIAVGRKLDEAGLRDGRFPTDKAIADNLGQVRENHFGKTVLWHRQRAVAALRQFLAATEPGSL